MSDVFIAGDGMHLRALRAGDLDGPWHTWLNDAEVTYFQDKGYFPSSREQQAEYFRRVSTSGTDLVLAIVDAASGRHVGNVGLHEITPIHRTAVLGIVIGEKEFWGRGFGRQAWALMTRHGFAVLNLNKIAASIMVGNERSLKAARASGYEVEGTQREQIYKDGAYRDMTLVGLTRAAWDARNGPSR